MFRFQNPQYLYLSLILIPIIAIYIYGRYSQNKRLIQFGDPELLKRLMPNVSFVRPKLKFYIALVALILMIFAAARPQFGSKLQSNQTKGVKAMILMDVSASMLAEDIRPNRLEYSKRMMANIVDNMQGDNVGLIVFAGDAFIQLPITSDNVSAKMFLSSIKVGMVPRPGTSIGSAIDLAVNALGNKGEEIGKTIILITDGENHEDDAIAAATLASENGISVNVVGLGSPDGEPIPEPGTMSFKKDAQGNVVVSRLNEKLCADIAAAGNGIYVRANNSNIALRTLEKEIAKLQKGEIDTKVYSQYDEKFFILAWIAFFFLVIEFYILNRQNSRLNRINWFDLNKPNNK